MNAFLLPIEQVPATLKRKDIQDPNIGLGSSRIGRKRCSVSGFEHVVDSTDDKKWCAVRLLNCMMVVGRPQKTSSQYIFFAFLPRSSPWPETNQASPRGPDRRIRTGLPRPLARSECEMMKPLRRFQRTRRSST
jgi:hypothetical protein